MEFGRRDTQAKLELQTRTLESDLKDLTRKHLDAEERVDQLQRTVRTLRHDGERRARELELAKQTCDRVVQEKRRLERRVDDLAADKRRLAEEVDRGADAKELRRRCEDLKAQMRGTERRLDDERRDLAKLRRTYDAQTKELSVVQRALSLKADELSAQCGLDVHARLLYAVAKGEEECVRLANRLSEVEHECRRLRRGEHGDIRKLLRDERCSSAILRDDVKSIERENKESHRRWLEAVKERDSAEETADALKRQIQRLEKELSEKDSALRRQCAKADEQENVSRSEFRLLRTELENVRETTQTKRAEYRRDLERKTMQIKSLKDLLERRDALAQEQLSHERWKREEALHKLKTERSAGHARPRSSVSPRDDSKLKSQVDCLMEELASTQSQLLNKEAELNALRSQNRELQSDNASLAESKARIQETLLEQIESIRTKLKRLEQRNAETNAIGSDSESEEEPIVSGATHVESSDSA